MPAETPDETWIDMCQRDGYICKEAQLERFMDAGVRYDNWISENYYDGDFIREEPTEEEDYIPRTAQKDFTEFDAVDEMRRINETVRSREKQGRENYLRKQAREEAARAAQSPTSTPVVPQALETAPRGGGQATT